jgi:hypothetical protein
MPPRFAYWTIILEGKPTAFRTQQREDLLPTFKQLQGKHPDAVMMWFARGRLWSSPEEAQSAETRSGERRQRDWRPGGEHRDPRARFDVPRDEKRRRFAAKLRRDRDEPLDRNRRDHERPDPAARQGKPPRPPFVRDDREAPRDARPPRDDRRPPGRADSSRPPRPDWKSRPPGPHVKSHPQQERQPGAPAGGRRFGQDRPRGPRPPAGDRGKQVPGGGGGNRPGGAGNRPDNRDPRARSTRLPGGSDQRASSRPDQRNRSGGDRRPFGNRKPPGARKPGGPGRGGGGRGGGQPR